LENYQLAIKYNPYLWQSPMNIATIYFKQGKYEEAVNYMIRAIKINPNNSLLYSNLGVIYLKVGDKRKAEEAFLTALRVDPNNQQARAGLLEITGL
jgi:Flp pilus assembly protein TadD